MRKVNAKIIKGADDLPLTPEQKSSCKLIIHGAATAAAGIGFVPIPGSDIGPITAIQMSMIIALAKVFDLTITEAVAKQAAIGFIVGNTGKMIAGSLSKLIPGLGSVICGGVAFSLTEALGWETVADFVEKYQVKEQKKAVEEFNDNVCKLSNRKQKIVDVEVVDK